jgi:hypothetical protein
MKEGIAQRENITKLKKDKKSRILELKNNSRVESHNLAQVLFEKARQGVGSSHPDAWKDMTLNYLKAAYTILVSDKRQITKKAEFQLALEVPIALLLGGNTVANFGNDGNVSSSGDSDTDSDDNA